MSKDYKWTDDLADEIWSNDRFYTIKECIEDAVNQGKKPGEAIAIGICNDYEPEIDVYNVLEELNEDAICKVGDIAEQWPEFDQEKGWKDAELLQAKLNKALKEWMEETEQTPSFYSVNPLRIVTIPNGKILSTVIRDGRGCCPKCNGMIWDITLDGVTFRCNDCKTLFKALEKGYAENDVILLEAQ